MTDEGKTCEYEDGCTEPATHAKMVGDPPVKKYFCTPHIPSTSS